MEFSENSVEKVKILVDNQQFWNMIAIHSFSPQLINRRLIGGSILHAFEYSQPKYNLKNVINIPDKLTDFGKFYNEDEFQAVDVAKLKSHLQGNFKELKPTVMAVKLIQKKFQNSNACMIVIFDVHENKTSYWTYQEDHGILKLQFGYYLTYKSSELELGIYTSDSLEDKSEWLKQIFSKFEKWLTSKSPPGRYNIPSQRLVNIEAYSQKYNQLKDKYGEDLVKDWPEVTDPQKFVFEDISIATYLLLLWRDERQSTGSTKLQSFIDVGCGNGLLVFILTSEGHPGIGVDLRRRKIWENYPETTKLLEKTINPMEGDQFHETDWIIGNHSDEMSPWIPVMAARNSPLCRFFLLPCCAYEFNGMKYQRRNCKNSPYHDFIDYTVEISEVCGFSVDIDRLRIPSTKRICIIGRDRKTLDNEALENFISEKSTMKFQARESIERVRNCTQLPKDVTSQIVEIAFRELVKKYDPLEWNTGITLDLPDLVHKIPENLLKVLKEECGGLQTLLKNHHQIFQVSQGQVKIRDPREIPKKKSKKSKTTNQIKRFKEKDCWFYLNHPNGCPLTDQDCTYRHQATS
ncbi:Probable tRNA (uracil-O(2)-)-methyltransferase [Sergentomyia squamirostris]